MAPSLPERARLVVIGGGPAGSTLGRILAGWGIDVLVVDAGRAPAGAEVIGPSAAPLLEKLALTTLFAARSDVAVRCDGVATRWSSGSCERLDHHEGAPSFSLDRGRLAGVLRDLAIASGCRWLAGEVVGRPVRTADGFELEVLTRAGSGAGIRTLHAAFVVDASGRQARVARALGARLRVDDRLVAVAAHAHPSSCRSTYLGIGLHAEGWSYRIDAPGVSTRALIADPRGIGGKRRGLRDAFVRAGCTPPDDDRSAPVAPSFLDASSAALHRCAGPGWLAVGDAATAFDPFSGQGLAQAFGSALAASHALSGHWLGDPAALRVYSAAVHAAYRDTRRGLRLRYAYLAAREPTSFWRARSSEGPASSHSPSTGGASPRIQPREPSASPRRQWPRLRGVNAHVQI